MKPSVVILLAVALRGLAAPAPAPLYNRDVRPILAEHCFQCHGQDDKARKGGLRLDVRDGALKGGKSGQPAIVPGNARAGQLLARLASHDPDEVMPPPDTRHAPRPADLDVLRRWIAAGARYEQHWAFIPPTRPAVPRVDGRTSAHPVDAFVRARLRREAVDPAPEAAPEVLARRLYLDLTGLPPTPSELDAHLAARKRDPEGAYRDLVERLLDSPRFGEKWARHWLDVARYADSDGYEKDLPRHQWPWRDWVIAALNRDLPYDQFVVEQVAGDLLPGAGQDQHVATGFLRNGMVNEEGAIIAEQFRTEGLVDRMDCLGKAVLGLTIQCAQCHSHKYDPLTQAEYYRLYAFLNNAHEATSWVHTAEQQAAIAAIHRGIADEEEAIRRRTPDWARRLAAWASAESARPDPWSAVDPTDLEWVGGLSHPERLPDKSVITLGFRPTEGELVFTGRTSVTNPTGMRLEALTHGDLPFNGPGRSQRGTFAVSELVVEARAHGSTNRFVRVALTNATADFAQPEQPLERAYWKGDADKRVVGPASFLVDGKDETAWGADRGSGRRHQDLQAVVQFANPHEAAFAGGAEFRVTLKYRHGGADGHGRQNHFLGRFRLAVTGSPAPVADPLPARARAILRRGDTRRSAADDAVLFAAWRATVPEFADANARIDALWRRHPEGGTILNLSERPPELARTTRILERGNWQKPGQAVSPAVPAFLNPLPKGAPADRLAFARWLVDRRSPTAARVQVNRTWQALFGAGLADTPEDFGLRAPMPQHPELLDWLAVEFMEPRLRVGPRDRAQARPWSLKHLLRVVVTSATYRQSSAATPDQLARDPQNRLLARGPRFRAEAEVVRDIALAASGLLHERVGGPSIFPPVPENLFALSFIRVDFWDTAKPPERYRRSLYVFRRRSMPDPVLSSLDAPNGDAACVRRLRSNTPLAALATLNEPVFVEASQALARRIVREGGDTDASRAVHGFRLCTGRAPAPAELEAVLRLLDSRRERIADGWLPAQEIAFGGPVPDALPPGSTPSQLAAWTIVSRVLLNLDATLTKE